MCKLRIIAIIPMLGLEILSDQRWINNTRDLIVNMDDDHLRNAVMWAYRKWKDEEGAKLDPQKVYNYTYREWYMILKACYDRRMEEKKECVRKTIQKARNAVRTVDEPYTTIASAHGYDRDYNNQKDLDFDTGIDAWMY